MRLDPQQRTALNAAFQYLHKEDRVFLFGSRVDDAKKGGDIDLLVLSEQPEFELSRNITREFFKHCEEKIDVVVVNPKQMTEEQALFIESIDKQPLTDL